MHDTASPDACLPVDLSISETPEYYYCTVLNMAESANKFHLRVEDVKARKDWLQRRMNQEMDQYFKNTPGIDSKTRKEVAAGLRSYLDEVVDLVHPSIELIDVLYQDKLRYSLKELMKNKNLSNHKIEPFDYALNDKVRQLEQELEEQTVLFNAKKTSAAREMLESRQKACERIESEIDFLFDQMAKEEDNEDSENSANNSTNDYTQLTKEDRAKLLARCEKMKSDYIEALGDLYTLKEDLPGVKKSLDTLDTAIRHFQGK